MGHFSFNFYADPSGPYDQEPTLAVCKVNKQGNTDCGDTKDETKYIEFEIHNRTSEYKDLGEGK